MKVFETIRSIAIIALIALIVFSFAACGGGDEPEQTLTFDSIAAFKIWLDAQPANTKATTYHVKLNVNDLLGYYGAEGSLGNALYTNRSNKYVSLDLSGSTFTSIGSAAFQSCTKLTSVTIPSTVTSIGNMAFQGCTSLTNITIPSGVTSIGIQAFYECTSLASVTIPSTVTSIGNLTFRSCTSLASVTIGSGVTSIGDTAFYECTSLTSVTFQGTIASGSFSTTVPFPGDLRDKYLAGGGGIGTYTRPSGGDTWTKQS